VETTLYFAKIARSFQIHIHALKLDINKANDAVAEAKGLLANAKELCQ
jgi:hypothetical protein